MIRGPFLHTLLEAYLRAPDTPHRATRADRAIAAQLHSEGVPLDRLLHAIRLATLRRRLTAAPPPIRSLAYYRAVALALTTEELDPHYVSYVYRRHRQLVAHTASGKPRLYSRNPALSGRR